MSKPRWRLPEGVKVWAVVTDCKDCGGTGVYEEYGSGCDKYDTHCECLTEYVIQADGTPRPVVEIER